jgi:hypothetical protein
MLYFQYILIICNVNRESTMKQFNRFYQIISLIAFTFLLFSCDSNNKITPAQIKKYSEYTDLEKSGLKGEVIGVANYSTSDCENCYYFTFYNEKGNIDKEFDDRDKDFLISRHYIYLSNILRNQINNYLIINGELSSAIDYLNYDSNFCLQSKTSYLSIDNKIRKEIYKYDKNGFPKEKIDLFKEKYYWNNGILDSQILIADNKVFSKKYFTKGRLAKEMIFDETGNLSKASSYKYSYKFDTYGNDIKQIQTSFTGIVDSFERVIIYKEGDLSKYYNAYIELEARMYQIKGKQSSVQDNNSFEYENNFQAQPRQKQWVNCKICHGTGLNICSECGGKGIRECSNCRGRGFYYDAQHSSCNNCGGDGQVQCNQCYGKGNRGSCSSCGGRGQVQE